MSDPKACGRRDLQPERRPIRIPERLPLPLEPRRPAQERGCHPLADVPDHHDRIFSPTASGRRDSEPGAGLGDSPVLPALGRTRPARTLQRGRSSGPSPSKRILPRWLERGALGWNGRNGTHRSVRGLFHTSGCDGRDLDREAHSRSLIFTFQFRPSLYGRVEEFYPRHSRSTAAGAMAPDGASRITPAAAAPVRRFGSAVGHGTGYWILVSSILRFMARPSEVELSPIGCASP